ncbi:MAG: hypothetical protein JWR21_932 [Herminiimonas sp.]|nr:hypothetical protein [Herminiimonas sp.]
MSDAELPPLPQSAMLAGPRAFSDEVYGYTSGQMREYALAALSRRTVPALVALEALRDQCVKIAGYQHHYDREGDDIIRSVNKAMQNTAEQIMLLDLNTFLDGSGPTLDPLHDPAPLHVDSAVHLADGSGPTVQCKSVPEGYVLVPIEPTEAMKEAWTGTVHSEQTMCASSDWSAMLAAAPKPPECGDSGRAE